MFKTTMTAIVAVVLLLANGPAVSAQKKKANSSEQEAETQFNVTLIEGRIPSVMQWNDAQTKAKTLAGIGAPLYKYDRERAIELFISAVVTCDSLGEDLKKVTACRQSVLSQIYKVDKTLYGKVVDQTKSTGNPYSSVIDDLVREGQGKEAADLIRKSVDKGFKEGLVSQLSQLRKTDSKTADQIFLDLIKSSGQLDPDQVLIFATYPNQSSGYYTVTGANHGTTSFPDILKDGWGDLNPEVIKTVLGTAIEARRDDAAKTWTMCKLLLPKALQYVPELAAEFQKCMDAYKFPEFSQGIDRLGAPPVPENFDEQLEKISALPDVRKRDGEFGRLATRALTAHKLDEAQKAVDKIDDISVGSFGKQLRDWVAFARAGEAVRDGDFVAAEKTAAKLDGGKAAWLWLAAGAGRRKQGSLAQAKTDLVEALKVARGIEDGKAPYLMLPAAAQLASDDKSSSPLDSNLAWDTLAELIKSLNKNDPKKRVSPSESITIPGVLQNFLSYQNFVPVPGDFGKSLLVFLASDKQKAIQEVSKIEDERILGSIYVSFASELLK